MTKDEQEAALRADLDALGIEYDGRWGVEKLQETLDAAKPKAPDMILCRVKRDFWPTDDENDRVRKGHIIEMSPMDAITAIESGAVERVK